MRSSRHARAHGHAAARHANLLLSLLLLAGQSCSAIASCDEPLAEYGIGEHSASSDGQDYALQLRSMQQVR